MIESALLWYQLYITVLKEEGFVVNAVDKCVANKFINGSQCTIAWYVNDNLLAHADAEVVDSVINSIEKEFPGLVAQKGNELDFLGIEINLRESERRDGEVSTENGAGAKPRNTKTSVYSSSHQMYATDCTGPAFDFTTTLLFYQIYCT